MPSMRNFVGSLVALCMFVHLSEALGQAKSNSFWGMLRETMTKEVAPRGEDGGPIVVKHSLQLQKVVSLEDDVLTLVLWEGMVWQDARIRWAPGMFNNVTQLNIPSRDIWQPDLLLYNSAQEYKGFPNGDVNAVITSDGNVSMYAPRITKSFCLVDDSLLEEDNEIACTLKYGSWTHSANSLDLRLQYQPGTPEFTSRHWQVVNVTAERHEVKYSCCPETYLDIEYTLRMKSK